MLNKDYKEILQIFIDNKVKFLVVGAYAMGVHGYPRATGDFDLWVEPTSDNSHKIIDSLKLFGAPLSDLTPETFTENKIIFQIGIAPRRIDIITHIDGVEFGAAYKNKIELLVENVKIPFLSKPDLIKNKESTGREKDRLDVKYLKSK
jgi:hypothetical protein